MALTNNDAKIVLGMLDRGDHNHDVAAWFGVNPARIDEVKKGNYGVTAAPAADLPPKGAPGPKGARLRARVRKALEALATGDVQGAAAILEDAAQKYDAHQS